MVLIDHCIENLPVNPEDVLHVPIPQLAHRVLGLYWQQVRPFEGQELRQRRTGTRARITDATTELRAAACRGNSGLSLDIAAMRAPDEYQRAIDKIAFALAKQPLPRLRKLPGSPVSDPFLCDDSFLGENVTKAQLKAHGNAITLKPGVAFGLARLAGLLKPADRVLERDPKALNEIADEIQWPAQRDRVVAAARGIFRGQPEGVPTWAGLKKTVRFDVAFVPDWMQPP